MTPGSGPDAPFVLLASYPKSGNTWLRAFLTGYLEETAPHVNDLIARPILCQREKFDELTGASSADLSLAEIDLLRPRFHRYLAAHAASPHFLKVHDRWYRNGAGEPIFASPPFRKAVHLVRHPAAVALSWAHHTQRSIGEAAAFMADAGALLGHRDHGIETRLSQRLGSWSSHAASWLDQSELPVRTVRYEDMLADPHGQFRAVLTFVGISPDEDRLAKAVERSRFEVLRDLERVSGFVERDGRHAFFRAGQAEAWRHEVEPALADRIRADHGETMARLGYGDGG